MTVIPGRRDNFMTTVSPTGSAALLILQQANATSAASEQEKTGTDRLIAAANGQADKVGVDKQPTQAASKISESFFSVNHVSINKLKLDLIDQAGRALGVNPDDFVVRKDFVDAMERALGKLKMEGGAAAVMKLEQELGLDKLGVSIDDVMDSARDPQANDKLTKALERQAGKTDLGAKTDGQDVLLVAPDEIGLYAASPAR